MSDLSLPFRQVNAELLSNLELESNKVYPLPGAIVARRAPPDPRLSHLKTGTVSGDILGPKESDKICYYEHIATIRDKISKRFYVAFRQTMDALMLEQNDSLLYPEWLIKSSVKKTELLIYIYQVYKVPFEGMKSHEDWLRQITDVPEFDTLAYFLLSKNVISQDMYGKMK